MVEPHRRRERDLQVGAGIERERRGERQAVGPRRGPEVVRAEAESVCRRRESESIWSVSSPCGWRERERAAAREMVVARGRVEVRDEPGLPEVLEPDLLVEPDVEGDPVPVVVPLLGREHVHPPIPEQTARPVLGVADVGRHRPPVGEDLGAHIVDLVAWALVLQGDAAEPAARELGQRDDPVVARQRGAGRVQREVLGVGPLVVAGRVRWVRVIAAGSPRTRLPVTNASSAQRWLPQ